ncbi:PTS system ascorbate-specific IIA component [Mycoplasma testudineum]|uniref:Ascorbate-specific PTS system EIIA component n=1 Tax=Mycoplasma testudineum TaxID=244584 RepID=A0A4V3C3I0_9MOLU|nr:PTS sugar transporter subunit IIA [Mycoplasma testudineum]OYD26446.1 PTS sugar transporter subunit IIAB [Mycoplasma testudineum]TDO22148.1 PTS system ascorbate-specific IIA component [Mycoplasma testudineum]
MDLLESLKNDSIKVKLEAKDWKQAVLLAVELLENKKIVDRQYYDAILQSTEEYGPYYIIADDLAMPHASNAKGVYENGFSLITLVKPVFFPNDDRPVSILIALAAKTAEIHTSKALPQIVAVFEDPLIVQKVKAANSAQEIIKIIEKIDYTKYLD